MNADDWRVLITLACWTGSAYVVGVGHGRWKAATWEARMRAWAAKVVELRTGARDA